MMTIIITITMTITAATTPTMIPISAPLLSPFFFSLLESESEWLTKTSSLEWVELDELEDVPVDAVPFSVELDENVVVSSGSSSSSSYSSETTGGDELRTKSCESAFDPTDGIFFL